MKLSLTIVVLSLLALLIAAQSIERQRGAQADTADPLGNYNVIVDGTVSLKGRDVAGISGLLARLHLPKQDATFTASFLSAIDAEDLEEELRGETPDADALVHTLGIQRGNELDLFINVLNDFDDDEKDADDDDKNINICMHASTAKTKLTIGQLKQLDQNLASQRNCTGSLWLREITSETETLTRTELYCLSDKKELVWIEFAHPEHELVIHLDVVDVGDNLELNHEGFSLFALPVNCVISPVESSDLSGIVPRGESARSKVDIRNLFKDETLGSIIGLAYAWLLRN